MRMSVKVDFGDIEKELANLSKQVRYGAARGLTKTATDIRDQVREDMRRTFDRPRDWTTNSMYVEKATRDNLTAVVGVKDRSKMSTRVTPTHTLQSQVFGHDRAQKRFERALTALGYLPPGWVVVPSRSVPRDTDGNLSGDFLRNVLRQLPKAGPVMPKKAVARARRTGGVYFVQPVGRGRGLSPGIYFREMAMRQATPIVLFKSRASYYTRLDFHQIGERVANERLQPNIIAAIEEALATAR